MAGKSPFGEEVYRDWEKLILSVQRTVGSRQPHPDQLAGWQSLYQRTREDGQWKVSAPDASLVSSLGVTLALQDFRFDDAARLSKEYFDHPDAKEGDWINWESAATRYGISLILCGEIEAGLSELSSILRSEHGLPNSQRHGIRNDLLQALPDLGLDDQPDSRISGYVETMLADWVGQEDKAQLANGANTYRELASILRSTF